jgi:hypothetical protein
LIVFDKPKGFGLVRIFEDLEISSPFFSVARCWSSLKHRRIELQYNTITVGVATNDFSGDGCDM